MHSLKSGVNYQKIVLILILRECYLKMIFLKKSSCTQVQISNAVMVRAVGLHMFEWTATVSRAKSMLQNMLFYLRKIKVLSHKARHQAYEEHQNMNHAQ